MESQKTTIQESPDADDSCKENMENTACATPSDVKKSMSAYCKMTVSQLKAECKAKGLLVSGNKTALVQRLMNPAAESSRRNSSGRKQSLSIQRVHKLLLEAGIKNPESKSRCLKRAIQRGFVVIDGKESLQQVIAVGKSLCCNKELKGTVKQLLDQPDYAGLDYEDGGQDAPLKCDDVMCGNGVYVTRMCEGDFQFDCGKFHSHCSECPGFGKCIGDYREAHCNGCNGHYFAGSMGNFPCHKCERRGEASNDCVLS